MEAHPEKASHTMTKGSGPWSAVATQRLSSLTHRHEMAFAWPWEGGEKHLGAPELLGWRNFPSFHSRLFHLLPSSPTLSSPKPP